MLPRHRFVHLVSLFLSSSRRRDPISLLTTAWKRARSKQRFKLGVFHIHVVLSSVLSSSASLSSASPCFPDIWSCGSAKSVRSCLFHRPFWFLRPFRFLRPSLFACEYFGSFPNRLMSFRLVVQIPGLLTDLVDWDILLNMSRLFRTSAVLFGFSPLWRYPYELWHHIKFLKTFGPTFPVTEEYFMRIRVFFWR